MTGNKRTIGSDLAKVDAYVNTAADYEELPDMSDLDPAAGVFQRAGVPVVGRPPIGEKSKKQITLRLDPDVIEAFKATGAGWQARMNDVLRKGMGKPALETVLRRMTRLSGRASLLRDQTILSSSHDMRADTATVDAAFAAAVRSSAPPVAGAPRCWRARAPGGPTLR